MCICRPVIVVSGREVSTVRLAGLGAFGHGRSDLVSSGICADASPFAVVERRDAVQREAEAGDPFEQPLEV